MGVTPYTSPMKDDILRVRRDYFINYIKAPVRRAAVALVTSHNRFVKFFFLILLLWKVAKYPEPTVESCHKHNSKELLRIWDKFMWYEDNPGFKGTTFIFRLLRKLSVCIYESDDYYAQRIGWLVEEVSKSVSDKSWRLLPPHQPFGCWIEPEVVTAQNKMISQMLSEISASH